MWSWFGGSAAQKRKDAPKDAILKLREQLDMLQKREKHLENLMEEQDAVARKNVTTNKNGMGLSLFLYRCILFPVTGANETDIVQRPSLPCDVRRCTRRTSNRRRRKSSS